MINTPLKYFDINLLSAEVVIERKKKSTSITQYLLIETTSITMKRLKRHLSKLKAKFSVFFFFFFFFLLKEILSKSHIFKMPIP